MENDKNKLSYFSLKMTDFIIDNHPDRIDEKDLIESRAESAQEEFERMSKEGAEVSRCMEASMHVLTQGLVFSPYKTVRDIIDECFSDKLETLGVDEEQMNTLTMHLLGVCKDIFNKYEIEDSFEGTYEYMTLRTEITGNIATYLEDNGI